MQHSHALDTANQTSGAPFSTAPSLHSSLRSLRLCGCRISDATLEAVATLTALTSLSLARCVSIKGPGLRHLGRKLRKLRELDLRWCALQPLGAMCLLPPPPALQVLKVPAGVPVEECRAVMCSCPDVCLFLGDGTLLVQSQ